METVANKDTKKELVRLGEEAYNRVIKYIFQQYNVIDNVAIKVLAGYSWAKNRHFDTFFDQKMFDADREYARNLLERDYSGKSLQETINATINLQAKIIWLRRVKEGEHQRADDYENDKWEAKRYIAYLFFEDIKNNCSEDGICPDFEINLISDEIIHLLKSLTVEDYCRIRGYLRFIDRSAEYGQKSHGYDHDDYLKGMGYLDRVFLNCSYQKTKQVHSRYRSLIDNEEKITKAKRNTCYRLGCIRQEAIERFVDEYYSLVRKIVSTQGDKKHAIKVLQALYDKSNSKIINMMEVLLRCMIASYVDKDEHAKIRIDAGKHEMEEVKKVRFKSSQKDPLWGVMTGG